MKKKILLLGTCRIIPTEKYTESNAGFFYKTNHSHNYEYHVRPYGQCTSIYQLYNELKNNYLEPLYYKENINNYICHDLNVEKRILNNIPINKTQNIISYNNYDGYVFEVSGFKYSLNKLNKIIAPDIATNPNNVDIKQKICKNDNEEDIYNILEKINILLEGKPILFVSPYKSTIPDRYKLQTILITFCKQYKHIDFFNPDYIIYSIGYSKTFKLLSENKSKIRKVGKETLNNINPIYETIYDTTHFTNIYKDELVNYFKNFFDLFLY